MNSLTVGGSVEDAGTRNLALGFNEWLYVCVVRDRLLPLARITVTPTRPQLNNITHRKFLRDVRPSTVDRVAEFGDLDNF